MSDKANAINDVDFLFERLIKTIKGRADVAQRLTAHVFAKTGHTTLEALYSSEDENTLKVIQECLKAALANPPDYSALMGSDAKGQAQVEGLPVNVPVAVTNKDIILDHSKPATVTKLPPSATSNEVSAGSLLTTGQHMIVERVPEPFQVKASEKSGQAVVRDIEAKNRALLAALHDIIGSRTEPKSEPSISEDRVRAIVREEIRAFFSTLGK